MKEKLLFSLDKKNFAQLVLIAMGILIGAYFLWQIMNILILFLIAFFIAAALDPLVDLMERFRLGRAWSLLIIYCISFLLFALIIAQLLPVLIDQIIAILASISSWVIGISSPEYWASSNLPMQVRSSLQEMLTEIDMRAVFNQLQSSLEVISSQLLNLSGNIFAATLFLFNGLMNLIIVLVLVFLLTVDERALENFFLSIFPDSYGSYITDRMNLVRKQIGHFIVGQFFVSLVAGGSTFVVLAIFGVKYSLTLSILAGLFMIIPVFGRVFAWVISAPIVLNQSYFAFTILSVYYLLVSQIENNYLVPKLMSKAVGLSPILIMLVLLIGHQLMGITGLVLAIPAATIIAIFVKDIGRKLHKVK